MEDAGIYCFSFQNSHIFHCGQSAIAAAKVPLLQIFEASALNEPLFTIL